MLAAALSKNVFLIAIGNSFCEIFLIMSEILKIVGALCSQCAFRDKAGRLVDSLRGEDSLAELL